MKKLLLISGLCLIVWGFCNAQDNKSISSIKPVEGAVLLYCGGDLVDLILIHFDTVDSHFIEHYTNGVRTWFIIITKMVIQSESGVNYKGSGFTKYWVYPDATVHYQINGDDGSHYIGSFSLNDETDEIEFSKAICTGN